MSCIVQSSEMAVRVQVTKALAQASQWAPGTWERVTGELMKAGLSEKGAAGGGRGSAHYKERPLASALLASAMHTTNMTAEVVSRLEGLRALHPAMLVGGGFAEEAVPEGTTLRAYLEQQIVSWANPTGDMLAQLAAEPSWMSAWTLELIPSAPWANLRVHNGKSWLTTAFAPEKGLFSTPTVAIRRKTELTLSILKVAGDLLADTLARQDVPSASGSMLSVGSTGPENKAAAIGPRQGNDAAALSDQPAQTELGITQSQYAGEREKTQPASKLRAGRSRLFDRSVNHDRYRHEPSAFTA